MTGGWDDYRILLLIYFCTVEFYESLDELGPIGLNPLPMFGYGEHQNINPEGKTSKYRVRPPAILSIGGGYRTSEYCKKRGINNLQDMLDYNSRIERIPITETTAVTSLVKQTRDIVVIHTRYSGIFLLTPVEPKEFLYQLKKRCSDKILFRKANHL